ncbi:hypothetical protein ACLOJK_008907 [Asimina triloba]
MLRKQGKTTYTTLRVLMVDDGGAGGSSSSSSRRRFAIRRKREWKMKMEIRPNYTDEEDEEDQAKTDERVAVPGMESLIAAATKAQKPQQQQQQPSEPQIRLHEAPACLDARVLRFEFGSTIFHF